LKCVETQGNLSRGVGSYPEITIARWQGLGEHLGAEEGEQLREVRGTGGATARDVWVRVEMMDSQKCRIVGKSQPARMMTNPIIFTRTRIERRTAALAEFLFFFFFYSPPPPQLECWCRTMLP
jgi:hypothetical protein